MQNWRLGARECIRDVVVRYNMNADSGRLEEAARTFTQNGVLEFGGPDRSMAFRGRDEILQLFESIRDAWVRDAQARDEAAFVRHHVTTHQIEVQDEQSARGRCYVAVIKPHGLDHWGMYVDRYERRDEDWLISHRRALTEGGPGAADVSSWLPTRRAHFDQR